MDWKIINLNSPDKKYIKNRTPLICKTIGILFFIFLIINKYYYNTFSLLDKAINCITILSFMLLIYYCFINFNSKNIMYVHYFIVLFIWIPLLLCKNPALLIFFMIFIIVILIGFH